MTKPSLRNSEARKRNSGCVLIVSVNERHKEIRDGEPIRPDGLVIRPRLIYHQEEGPVAPPGLP